MLKTSRLAALLIAGAIISAPAFAQSAPDTSADQGPSAEDTVAAPDEDQGRDVVIVSALKRETEPRPSVVLIDEIDVHLHPEWQRSVVKDLTNAFPKVQFICSSHSPQVFGELPKEQIWVHSEKTGAWHHPSRSLGVDSSRILDEEMDASSANADHLKKKGELAAVIDKEKAALHGLSAATISQTLKIAVDGETVDLLHQPEEKEDVNIRLELPRSAKTSPEELLALRVRSGDANALPEPGASGSPLVPLRELVKVEHVTVEKSLYHKNLMPVTYVIGDVAGVVESPVYAIFKMNEALKKLDTSEFGGSGAELQILNAAMPFSDAEPALNAPLIRRPRGRGSHERKLSGNKIVNPEVTSPFAGVNGSVEIKVLVIFQEN